LTELDCIDVPIETYTSLVFQRSNTIWLGKFISPSMHIYIGNKNLNLLSSIFHINNIKTRHCKLLSCGDWIKFIETCYSLGCENCGEDGWSASEGRKLKFDVWMDKVEARKGTNSQNPDLTQKCTFFKYDDSKFRENNVILTVYDEGKTKRLIIDGLHRAAALTMACEEGKSISEVKVLECYGMNVDIIFPLDIHQLPGN